MSSNDKPDFNDLIFKIKYDKKPDNKPKRDLNLAIIGHGEVGKSVAHAVLSSRQHNVNVVEVKSNKKPNNEIKRMFGIDNRFKLIEKFDDLDCGYIVKVSHKPTRSVHYGEVLDIGAGFFTINNSQTFCFYDCFVEKII